MIKEGDREVILSRLLDFDQGPPASTLPDAYIFFVGCLP